MAENTEAQSAAQEVMLNAQLLHPTHRNLSSQPTRSSVLHTIRLVNGHFGSAMQEKRSMPRSLPCICSRAAAICRQRLADEAALGVMGGRRTPAANAQRQHTTATSIYCLGERIYDRAPTSLGNPSMASANVDIPRKIVTDRFTAQHHNEHRAAVIRMDSASATSTMPKGKPSGSFPDIPPQQHQARMLAFLACGYSLLGH
ncbi:unnamed protein product [Zymoseptoria tritici ST99CH_1E4]|uniref:Uncharacterized protein n=1 Tax=Zymoseptoria tritici ST99CH_1E4 TaxID=1276532 RepID=A0A2H1GQ17_ZYMTR|nr:unnamed protein product [Zymoseptoria tritici ST99CH_1E4]